VPVNPTKMEKCSHISSESTLTPQWLLW